MLVVPQSMFDNLNFWSKMMLYRYMGRVTQTLGKASLIKKKTFNKIGVFDSDNFRTSGEDCEFYMRLNKNGMDMTPIEDLVDHNHRITNATIMSVIKKEIQMGQAHGAVKRKYPFKRIGKFDIEYRVAALILGIIGLLIGGFYSIIGLLLLLIPIIVIPILQATKNLYQTKWIVGGIAYLIIGPGIYLIQTYSAMKAFILGQQTI
jgi:hypothetical protein